MTNSDNLSHSIDWSSKEIELINTVDVFIHKPEIFRKAETRLHALKNRLALHLSAAPQKYPKDADLSKGQIAKGENNLGFPYISCDLPQLFQKDQFFTYRALFWWGHYLGFSLILKGDSVPVYTDRLFQNRTESLAKDLLIAKGKSLWDWEITDDNYQKFSSFDEQSLKDQVSTLGFLKLLCVHPVADPEFLKLDWTETGLSIFEQYCAMIL